MILRKSPFSYIIIEPAAQDVFATFQKTFHDNRKNNSAETCYSNSIV